MPKAQHWESTKTALNITSPLGDGNTGQVNLNAAVRTDTWGWAWRNCTDSRYGTPGRFGLGFKSYAYVTGTLAMSQLCFATETVRNRNGCPAVVRLARIGQN